MRYVSSSGLFLFMTLVSVAVFAGQTDFSGEYDCKGLDSHEGPYTGVVTMKLRPEHSKEGYSSYDFKLEVPGFGVYSGHAAAQGHFVAMHFALPSEGGVYGGKTQDFGTGIAEMKQKHGKWSFKKFYFEPAFKGGNTGTEECTHR